MTENDTHSLSRGLPVGLVLGAIFGVGAWFVFDSLPIGIGFGIAMAPAFALALGTRGDATVNSDDTDDTDDTVDSWREGDGASAPADQPPA